MEESSANENGAVINVIGKYTFENVKEIKEQTPVNENNIMELTSAYIDEDELETALIPYATKTLMYSEVNPINIEIENIKDELNDKPSFAWVMDNLQGKEPDGGTSFSTVTCDTLESGSVVTTSLTSDSIETSTISTTDINGWKIPNHTSGSLPGVANESIPVITSDGVMEIGKYIDFHNTLDHDTDYTIRLTCNDNNLGVSSGLNASGDVTCTNLIVNSSIYASSGDIRGKSMYATTQISSPIVLSSESVGSGWTSTCIKPGVIEFKNADGAHWNMRCYTGDSGTGRIAFKDFHNGAEIRIDPTNILYSKLNTTITHNAPINEPIEAFQLGSPVFSTGIIHHYDPETKMYVAGIDDYTNCIPSVKTIGSYKQYLGICTNIHPSGSTLLVGDGVKVEVTIEQPTITFATHGDFLFRVNNSSQYEVGDVVLFDGNKLDENLMITTKIQQSIVGKVTGIVDEHLLCIFKD